MGTMKAMGLLGDTKLEWDPDDEEETEKARASFEKYLAKDPPFKAFRLYDGQKQGQEIDEFDPHAERILLVPAMAGGAPCRS